MALAHDKNESPLNRSQSLAIDRNHPADNKKQFQSGSYRGFTFFPLIKPEDLRSRANFARNGTTTSYPSAEYNFICKRSNASHLPRSNCRPSGRGNREILTANERTRWNPCSSDVSRPIVYLFVSIVMHEDFCDRFCSFLKNILLHIYIKKNYLHYISVFFLNFIIHTCVLKKIIYIKLTV